ncbi:alpha-1,2-fucosyltransferase [Marinitoga aeolica]|uniref:Alpha-1,2-fucosyltransferase n=1 Tax=Marinitoga aeolica TaxID=2809031 RepID=A0ABY8PMT5_9BACT|nr:alpha-1,2-fucosyltransferase [Marinitoga aeolica]WGS63879.1 alpha-1,2-fucosyltransferase [Marinitoga aeolica]
MGEINKKIKFVKFKGGLGNQLFQYAFLKNIERYCNCKVKGDFSHYNNLIKEDLIRVPRILKMNVNIDIATEKDLKKVLIFKSFKFNPKSKKYKMSTVFETLFNRKYFFEFDRKYRTVKDIINYIIFDGYWQSWRYVKNVEKILKKEITLRDKISKKNAIFIDKVTKEESVFIGIRKGDYHSTKKSMNRYGIFDENYFNRAIEIIKRKVLNPKFYVFSNDIDWVKNNIKFDEKVIYREKKDQVNDLEELFVLGSFKHAIIVNSTFYWWGAWLINNKDKIVIAPKEWFNDGSKIDIVPPEWIKLSRRN